MEKIILFQILLSFVQLFPLANPIVEVGDRDIINININQHCHDSQCQQNIKLIQRNVSQGKKYLWNQSTEYSKRHSKKALVLDYIYLHQQAI